jgi:hypothetical protein
LTIATVGGRAVDRRPGSGAATRFERQQLKWFGYWAAVVAAAARLAMLLLGSPTEDAAFNVFVLSLAVCRSPSGSPSCATACTTSIG